MKNTIRLNIALVVLAAIFISNENSCSEPAKTRVSNSAISSSGGNIHSSEFKKYWFQGQAELNVYAVQQERYGEMREAQQVMIFVTEDFSASKQVKLDNPGQAGADRLPVLKLNAIRRFHTGIYDYALMESVFSPLNGAPSVKNTVSIQDWCGHVFTQFNYTEQAYRTQLFSYFETEGDSDTLVRNVDFLESDFWTRLRLNPEMIKPGRYRLLPSAFFSRLRHKPLRAEPAEVYFESRSGNPERQTLVLKYPELDRVLKIQFEPSFPFKIIGWEEHHSGKILSSGMLQKTIKTAYWNLNQSTETALRDSLFLFF
ncbi:MAG: hypothetical protein IPM36_13240 [Lewinellaceae bacterium]|nr:hypothetical protein [Lewinellaceae bacterium]